MAQLYKIRESYPGLESMEIEVQDLVIQDRFECDSTVIISISWFVTKKVQTRSSDNSNIPTCTL